MRRLGTCLLALLVSATSCAGERPTFDDSVAREVDPVEREETTTAIAAERPIVRLAVADGWSLDPADADPASLTNRVVADLLYEGLTSLDDLGLPQAAHAERWFTSDDRLTWTFVLSNALVDGAGEPFSARDAK
jgi:ABC-type oligopeptide transport system substrate-binding subunit